MKCLNVYKEIRKGESIKVKVNNYKVKVNSTKSKMNRQKNISRHKDTDIHRYIHKCWDMAQHLPPPNAEGRFSLKKESLGPPIWREQNSGADEPSEPNDCSNYLRTAERREPYDPSRQ